MSLPIFSKLATGKRKDELNASGLFDRDWYSRRYAIASEIDSIDHYMTAGWRSGNAPGPLFDTKWYLNRYPDVSIDPLRHFIRYGCKEGRQTRTIGELTELSGPTLSLNCGRLPPTPVDLVVMVHVYYLEVFDEILLLLKNIPVRFTLCVGIVKPEHRKYVEKAVFKQKLDATLICRLGQNKGKNFGTMLVDFSDEIEKHDLLLHLHTKRSLYTGSDQTGWRNYLFFGLVGSCALVRGVINLLLEKPEVGLFYPKTFHEMPYWAHHWLSNAEIAPKLLDRIGVTGQAPQGYFEFPVGGMFWARVDALRPLFAARFSYDEFPEETGQADGTLAHAIERAIGVLSGNQGFSFVEFDYAEGILRLDWSDRNLVQYRAQSIERVDAMLQDVDLVSFDIFDTLVVRPSKKPDAILEYVGWMMRTALPGNDFFERRKGAEAKARAKNDFVGDVDIHDIYVQFPATDGWTAELIRKAKEFELALDLDVVRPRPKAQELVNLARQRGRRIIAISDTYLPKSEILAILTKCGFNNQIDEIYVSNAEQARKDRGDLWARIGQLEKVEPARWLHVGDNEQSDIQAACDRGLKFLHLMNPVTLANLRGFDPPEQPESATWASDLVLGPAVLRVAGDPFLNGDNFDDPLLNSVEDVGYVVFGPVVFAFLNWLISHPALPKVQHLLFLSREGHTLQRAYEAIRLRCADMHLPCSTYFLSSRRAALGASQAVCFSPERIMGGPGFTGTFQNLLNHRIGFDIHDGALGSWPIELPRDLVAVGAALDILRDDITAHSTRELEGYRRYMERVGVAAGRTYGIVDVGYSGTIQKSLQEIIDATFVGFYMGTEPGVAKVEDGGGFAFGCFSEGVDLSETQVPVMKYSLAMEAFLTAPHGQVLSFGYAGPTMKARGEFDFNPSILERMHAASEQYCIDLIDAYGSSLISVPVDLGEVQKSFRMFCEGKLLANANFITSLAVEDDYCGSTEHQPFYHLAR